MNAANLGAAVELQIPQPCAKLAAFIHHLYKLEKVLHFSCHIKKPLNSLKVLEKILDFFTKSWKVLKIQTPCYATLFSVKLDYRYFAEENWGHPWCKNQYNSAWTIFYLICFFISNSISVPQMQLQIAYPIAYPKDWRSKNREWLHSLIENCVFVLKTSLKFVGLKLYKQWFCTCQF